MRSFATETPDGLPEHFVGLREGGVQVIKPVV